MNKEEIQVGLNISATISDAESKLQALKKSFGQLDLGKEMKASLNQAMADLTAEIDNLKNKTDGGKSLKLIDEKGARASISKIQSLINILVTKSGSKGVLSAGLAEDKKKIDAIEKAIQSVNSRQDATKTSAADYAKQLEKAQITLEKNQKAQEAANKAYSDRKAFLENEVAKAKEAAEIASKKVAGKDHRSDGTGSFMSKDDVAEGIKQTEEALKRAEAALEHFNKTGSDSTGRYSQAIQTANRNVNNSEQEVSRLSAAYEKLVAGGMQDLIKKADELGIPREKLSSFEDLQKYLNELVAQYGPNAEKVIQQLGLDVADLKKDGEKAREGFEAARSGLQDMSDASKELDQLKNRIQYFFGLTNATRLFRRAIQSAINTVKDLDAVMTEAAVVTDFSVGDMWSQLPEYTKRANALGVSIHDAYESATLYYQQGLKTNEVVALSNETLKMARIAGLGAEEATQRMTNALRGFNMELSEGSAQKVNDVYSSLAAHAAANTDQISTAMTKVASLAHNANMELETTAAFLTQIIETTQESAETAGTALKTVIARFSEVKKLYSSGELTGQDEEGEGIDVNKVASALKTAGIDMTAYFQGAKGLDKVFMELAQKWDSLDTVQQRYIATMAAGSRQQSRFIAMMSDYARTQELVGIATNSAGASQEQFEKTLESFEAKVQQLKNAWDEFTMGLANSTIIKTIIDILTSLVNVFNEISSFGPGALQTITKIFMALMAFKALKAIFVKGISGLSTFLQGPAQQAGRKTGQSYIAGIASQINNRGPGATKIGTGIKSMLTSPFKSLGTNMKGIKTYFKDIKTAGTDMAHANTNEMQKLTKNTEQYEKAVKDAAKVQSEEMDPNKFKETYGVGADEVQKYDQAVKQSQNTMQNGQAAFASISNGLTMASGAAMGLSTIFMLMAEMFPGMSDELQTVGKVFMIIGVVLGLVSTAFSIFGKTALKAGGEALTGELLAEAGLPPLLAAVLIIIAALIIIIALIVGLIALFKYVFSDKDAEKLEEINEQLASVGESLEDAKDKLNALEEGRKNLDNMTDSLHNLTRGTKEWRQQLLKVNQQVLDLINQYPELAAYLSHGEDGELTISDKGWDAVIEKQQQSVIDLTTQQATLNKQRLELESKMIRESYDNGDISKNERDVQLQAKAEEMKAVETALASTLMAANTHLSGAEQTLAASMLASSKSFQDLDKNINAEVERLGAYSKYGENEKGDNFDNLKRDYAAAAGYYFDESSGKIYKDAKKEEEAPEKTNKEMRTLIATQKEQNKLKSKEEEMARASTILTAKAKSGDKQAEAMTRLFLDGGANLTEEDLKIFGNMTNGELKTLFEDYDINWDALDQNIGDLRVNFNNLSKETSVLKDRFSKFGMEKNSELFSDVGVEYQTKLANQLEAYAAVNGQDAASQLFGAISGAIKDLTKEQKEQVMGEIANTDLSSAAALDTLIDHLRSFGVDDSSVKSIITTVNSTSTVFADNLDKIGTTLSGSHALLEQIRDNTAKGLDKEAVKAAGFSDEDIKRYFSEDNEGKLYANDPAQITQMILDRLGNVDYTQEAIDVVNAIDKDNFSTALNNFNTTLEEHIAGGISSGAFGQILNDLQVLEILYKKGAISEKEFTTQQTKLKNGLNVIANKFPEYAGAIDQSSNDLSKGSRVMAGYSTATKNLYAAYDKLEPVVSKFAKTSKKIDYNDWKIAAKELATSLESVYGLQVDPKWVEEHQQLFVQLAEGSEIAADKLWDYYLEQLNVDAEGQKIIEDFKNADIDMEGNLTISTEAGHQAINNFIKAAQAAGLQIVNKDGKLIAYNPFAGFAAKARSSKSGGGGNDDTWDNPYDELYNLSQKINESLRERNKLERQFAKLTKSSSSSQRDLVKGFAQQIAQAEKEIELQKQMLEGRKRQAANVLNEEYKDSDGKYHTYASYGLGQYAWIEDGKVQINDALMNALDKTKDTNKGAAVEAYVSRLEELVKAQEEAEDAIWDLEDTVNDKIQEVKDAYLDIEGQIADVFQNRDQKVIDAFQEYSDKISDTQSKVLSAMQESIDLEHQIRDNTKTEEDIADKEARLAFLQRDTTGANQNEILKLQQEIDDARQSYTDSLIDQQIQEMQTANDKAAQQREEQIALMQEMVDDRAEWGVYRQAAQDFISTNDFETIYKTLQESDEFKALSKFGEMDWEATITKSIKEAITGQNQFAVQKAQDIGTLELNGESWKFDKIKNQWINSKGQYYNKDQLMWDTSTGSYRFDGELHTPQASQSAPAAPPTPTLSTGQWVTIKSSARKFANGDYMASWVPGSSRYVYQIKGDKVLVGNGQPGGYTGWVNKSDIEGQIGSQTTTSTKGQTGSQTTTSTKGQTGSQTENQTITLEQPVLSSKEKFEIQQLFENNPSLSYTVGDGIEEIGVTINGKRYPGATEQEIQAIKNTAIKVKTLQDLDQFKQQPRETSGNAELRIQEIIDTYNKNKLNKAYDDTIKYFTKKAVDKWELNINHIQFATGGLADFTGPAWLDGTKSHPELVLNQRDTANFIQLRDILGSLLTSEGAGATNAAGDAYFDIDINAEIGSDYDVDQLIERLRQEIVDNSNYRNVNTLGFMR